ncbi:unnamed protein product, partial [Hymenolepis diminuta]
MSSLKPDADGFFEVAGRKRNRRDKNTSQGVRFNIQRPRVISSTFATSSNAITPINTNARSNAIEKDFDEILEKIPHLQTIMNTIDTTETQKIHEHRKDLNKALVAIENAKKDKYFFITCSITSLGLFLQDLSDLVEKSCKDKQQEENLEYIKKTKEQFKEFLSAHANAKIRIYTNPYRNIDTENSSKSSKDDAQSDSDSSKTIVAGDKKESRNQGENGAHGVGGMKNPSLKRPSKLTVSGNEEKQASSSTKSSGIDQDETTKQNQGTTKRSKRNRRKKNTATQQEEEIKASDATKSEDQRASSSTKSSQMDRDETPEQNQG